MEDNLQAGIIKDSPVGKGLDAFRDLFRSMCEERGISRTSEALGQLNEQGGRDKHNCNLLEYPV